jgi:lysine 2,3-aminomutase
MGRSDGTLIETLFGASKDEWNDWYWQFKSAIRTPRALYDLLSHPLLRHDPRLMITDAQWAVVHDAHQPYRMNISPFNLFHIIQDSLDGNGHVTDHPLWTLLVPNGRERGEGIRWPRSEPSPAKGLLSFYGCTVDLVVTSACPVNCRMCTRKNVKFPGVAAESLQRAIEFIEEHTEVKQVVLTGGDALVLSNERLYGIIRRLKSVDHLQSIRIATRALTAMPMRITHDEKFLAELRSVAGSRPVPFVHTFVAHPCELGPECRAAVEALRSAGLQVYNSTVLSRGINDSYSVLSELASRLCEVGVVNHHLFQCDIGEGLDGFWVPIDRAHSLFKRLYLEWPHSMGGPRDLMTTIAGEGRITFPATMDLDAVTVEFRGEEFVRIRVDVTGNVVKYPRTGKALRMYRRDPFGFIERDDTRTGQFVANPQWAAPSVNGRRVAAK